MGPARQDGSVNEGGKRKWNLNCCIAGGVMSLSARTNLNCGVLTVCVQMCIFPEEIRLVARENTVTLKCIYVEMNGKAE